MRIAIAGAGSVGCYVGGCLALAGRPVTLLLRARLRDELAAHGLRITDREGLDRTLPGEVLCMTTDPTGLAEADLVLVTVKSGATAEIARLLASHVRPGATLVSLQNGVGNAEVLAEALPHHRVVPGMVPFNVVQMGAGRFHRATGGGVLIGMAGAGVLSTLAVEGLPIATHPDMTAVLWGKLLINLNNALVALADVPLARELADRRWRSVLSAQQREALRLLSAAGIRPAKATALPPRLLPWLLLLPDPLFRRVAGRMLAVDPEARSSMWEDLKFGRPTEVDHLQGAIVALADRLGRDAPVNRHVLEAVKAAERAGKGPPGLSPDALSR